MKITKQTLAEKIAAYLHHETQLPELVDWAENALMDGEFPPGDSGLLTDITARIGLADVRTFGLTWEDCESFLNRLGYAARVEIVAA